jgi:Sigma-70, region 4/Sigma-70 region 3
MLRRGGVDSEKYNTRLFQRGAALDGNLPEVLIQRQHDACFRLGAFEEGDVFPPDAICPCPQDIVAMIAKRVDNRPGEVLVGEYAHLRRDRISFVFVSEVACVGQAGENVISCQTGVICLEVVLGLARSEKFEDELDGQARSPDYGFACEDLGIEDNALGKRHNHSLPRQREIGRRMDIPVEKVQKLKTISRDPVSLETPVGRDGESALGDLIEDRWVGSPVDAVIDSNVRDETANILKTLSPKEEKVIRLRFGIGCEREHTLEEIGQEFDVTRERIRQIEAKALRQLRSPERARHLRALLAAR